MEKKDLLLLESKLDGIYHGGLVNVASTIHVLSEALFNSQSSKDISSVVVDGYVVCDMLSNLVSGIMTDIEGVRFGVIELLHSLESEVDSSDTDGGNA